MSIFALAPFAGPSIGPIISGYIQVSGTVSQILPQSNTLSRGLVGFAALICGSELEMGVLDDHDLCRSVYIARHVWCTRDLPADDPRAKGEEIEEGNRRREVVRTP